MFGSRKNKLTLVCLLLHFIKHKKLEQNSLRKILTMHSVVSKLISPLLLTLLLGCVQESRGQGESLVPAGLFDFVPAACMPSLNEDVLPCAIENLCFTLLPTEEELAAIPDETMIGSCLDIEAGLCPITTRCPQCKELADSFFKCIIFENEEGTISAEMTELIAGCSLDCSGITGTPTAAPVDPPSEPPVEPVSEPTEAPVAPPVPGSVVPTDAPEAPEATEAPVDSGAVTMMTSTGAIISCATSFVAGWFFNIL